MLYKVVEANLLTESEVERSFRRLFKNLEVSDETFDKAEALIDELRPENPLRHRLTVELDELREHYASNR
ncbi:MAG: hypothetical protein QGG71_07760 [Pirellulaceae bacterium]|jgi:hypothetical protein|nr:hypothetical protein [Pirellulaceae bacterium]